MNRLKKQQKGFTILEVLLSAAIIAVMLAALVAIGQLSLNTNQLYLQRSQATYLAQESLELARERRDTNWIDRKNGTMWDGFDGTQSVLSLLPNENSKIYGPLCFYPTSGQYYFSWRANDDSGWEKGKSCAEIIAQPAGTPAAQMIPTEKITLDSGASFYRYLVFQRVTTSLLPDTPSSVQPGQSAIKVTAVVKWRANNSSGDEKTVSISEILTNWRPNY